MLIVSKIRTRVEQVNRESVHFLCAAEGDEAYTPKKTAAFFPSRDMERLESCGIRGKDPQHRKVQTFD